MNFGKIRFLLIMLLAMSIVLELTPAFIVIPALSIALIIVEDRFNLKVTAARVSQSGWFLVLIFLIHALWFLPHIATTLSTKLLERYFPYLFFPLMISTTRIDGEGLNRILRFFILCVVISYALSLLAAVYHFFYSVPRWGRPSDSFFHEQFTDGLFRIHPTYYSLLGCIATLFAFIVLTKKWRVLAVVFLTLVILLIDARATLLIQVLLIFAFILKGFSKGFSVKRVLVLLASAAVLFVLVRVFATIYDYPHRKILINMESAWARSFAPDITDGDGGIVVRMAIWREAVTVIKDHPVFGVGLAREDEYLAIESKKNNVAFLVELSWNAHNQALSYLITFGVFGFALLAFIYFRLMRDAFRAKCRVYFALIVIFAGVALTESIFNRLLGISLFAFFNALIMLKLVNHDK